MKSLCGFKLYIVLKNDSMWKYLKTYLFKELENEL